MTLKIVAIGDVVGRPGRAALVAGLSQVREQFSPDVVIVNGENSAGGLGIDQKTLREILQAGADVVTLGDHTWKNNEFRKVLDERQDVVIRPANYPSGAPGAGALIKVLPNGFRLGVMNIIGRTFIDSPLDCPFRAAEEILRGPLKECDGIVCDFHAEATSEKYAMRHFLTGRVSFLFGTHTHVQTADEHVTDSGMAYITDLGMTGVQTAVIGMSAEVAFERFYTGLPKGYRIANGEGVMKGALVTLDGASGKALGIERVSLG